MRKLTAEEQHLLDHHRARFDTVINERMPVLADFADRLELNNPTQIVADPDRYLPAIAAFMRDQVVEPDDRAWIAARMAYLIGEVLVQRLHGCWLLNEIPDSRYFARYVVGRFTGINNLNAMADPFEAAAVFVDLPPGRDLVAMIAEVEGELRAL